MNRNVIFIYGSPPTSRAQDSLEVVFCMNHLVSLTLYSAGDINI